MSIPSFTLCGTYYNWVVSQADQVMVAMGRQYAA